jgi:hypothetical protein
MAKKKAALRFDFSGAKFIREPHLYIKDKLSEAEIFSRAESHWNNIKANGGYIGTYFFNYLENAKVAGLANVTQYVQTALLQAAFSNSPVESAQFNSEIMAWYASHEGAQEVYKACAKDRWYWHKDNKKEYSPDNSNRLSTEEARAQGLFDAPRDYIDIGNIIFSREASTYTEVNREQIFEEGDIVCLRKPYVGRYQYDPKWNDTTVTADTVRYGSVMAQGTGELMSWRGAKGSRKITVLWFGKNENMDVPEKAIKLQDRKGRITRS